MIMAAKRDARSMLRKQLGKDAADAMLNKVDNLAKKGASAGEIERWLLDEIASKIETVISVSVNRGLKTGVRKGIKTGVTAIPPILMIGREPGIKSGSKSGSGNYRK
jgi:hypothetical protein